jgi:L-iditol 2-dehydrogenase
MKVAVYYRNNDIRIEEKPQPAISDREILVKMKASGICGTDVMEWYRIKKAPRILGHEMAGEIEKVGKEIKDLKKGDRVFVSHHVPCYDCHLCEQGNYTACETLHSGNYDPGGFAEHIRIPEENIKYGTFILPENMTFEEATMIEPLGCVIAGQNQIGLSQQPHNQKQKKSVLIIGSGISGLLHIQLAKKKGVRIIATDIDDDRLKKAKEFGADHAIHARSYSVDKLKEINNGVLADVVIVCASAEKAIEDALSSVERKGTLLFFAIPNKNIVLPSQHFWRNEITVTFSYGAGPDDLKEAMKSIEHGAVNVIKLITHRFPLSQIQEGFQLVSEARKSLKVVITPD